MKEERRKQWEEHQRGALAAAAAALADFDKEKGPAGAACGAVASTTHALCADHAA